MQDASQYASSYSCMPLPRSRLSLRPDEYSQHMTLHQYSAIAVLWQNYTTTDVHWILCYWSYWNSRSMWMVKQRVVMQSSWLAPRLIDSNWKENGYYHTFYNWELYTTLICAMLTFTQKHRQVNNCLDSQDALAFEINLRKQNFAQFGWLTIMLLCQQLSIHK